MKYQPSGKAEFRQGGWEAKYTRKPSVPALPDWTFWVCFLAAVAVVVVGIL